MLGWRLPHRENGTATAFEPGMRRHATWPTWRINAPWPSCCKYELRALTDQRLYSWPVVFRRERDETWGLWRETCLRRRTCLPVVTPCRLSRHRTTSPSRIHRRRRDAATVRLRSCHGGHDYRRADRCRGQGTTKVLPACERWDVDGQNASRTLCAAQDVLRVWEPLTPTLHLRTLATWARSWPLTCFYYIVLYCTVLYCAPSYIKSLYVHAWVEVGSL